MKGNSRKAYKPLKNLSNDPTKPEQAHNEITANQVAHQLLMNGKTNKRIPKTKLERNIANEKKFLNDDFCIRELQEAIKMMKNNKAAEQLSIFVLLYMNFHEPKFRQLTDQSYALRQQRFRRRHVYTEQYGSRRLEYIMPKLLNEYCDGFMNENNNEKLKKKLKESILRHC
ncbi:hypothetical protein M8J77_011499 [Diaphorina citri]|nr:hypothetical protein M8J77_011499 [Diaphorina citri]